LPAGMKENNNSFSRLFNFTGYLSTYTNNVNLNTSFMCFKLNSFSDKFEQDFSSKTEGFSVRCLKD
jgi:hypothetical protein